MSQQSRQESTYVGECLLTKSYNHLKADIPRTLSNVSQVLFINKQTFLALHISNGYRRGGEGALEFPT